MSHTQQPPPERRPGLVAVVMLMMTCLLSLAVGLNAHHLRMRATDHLDVAGMLQGMGLFSRVGWDPVKLLSAANGFSYDPEVLGFLCDTDADLQWFGPAVEPSSSTERRLDVAQVQLPTGKVDAQGVLAAARRLFDKCEIGWSRNFRFVGFDGITGHRTWDYSRVSEYLGPSGWEERWKGASSEEWDTAMQQHVVRLREFAEQLERAFNTHYCLANGRNADQMRQTMGEVATGMLAFRVHVPSSGGGVPTPPGYDAPYSERFTMLFSATDSICTAAERRANQLTNSGSWGSGRHLSVANVRKGARLLSDAAKQLRMEELPAAATYTEAILAIRAGRKSILMKD